MRVTNDTLKRYLELDATIKELDLEKQEIRDAIVAQGEVNTKDYLAIVQEQIQNRIVSLSEVVKKHGQQFVNDYELAQQVEIARVIVKRKAA